jgi:ABC-type transport system substrate-binding protein
MNHPPVSNSITRRDLLKAGGAAAVAGLASGADLLAPASAMAQTPKRGGTLRLVVQADPLTGFDPHQTISFLTMVPLSFAYSRLVKVKAGPSVKPMTYPIEPDLAESWTQPDDKTARSTFSPGAAPSWVCRSPPS